eukprot:5850571-Amphidinium_carterae.1
MKWRAEASSTHLKQTLTNTLQNCFLPAQTLQKPYTLSQEQFRQDWQNLRTAKPVVSTLLLEYSACSL